MKVASTCFHLLALAISFSSSVGNLNVEKLGTKDPLPRELTSDSYDANNTDRIPLRIVASLSYSSFIFTVGPIASEPIRYVLNQVKKLPNFLSKYEIIFEPFDDMALEPFAVNGLMQSMLNNDKAQNRLPIVVGSGLTLRPTDTCEHFNVLAISPGVLGDVSKHQYSRFKNLLVSMPTVLYYYEQLLPNFIAAVGWKRIAIIGSNIDYNIKFHNTLANSLKRIDSEIEIVGPFMTVYVTGQLAAEDQVEQAVRQLKAADARVILINLVPASLVVCYLYKFGMFGPNYSYLVDNGYVFSPTDMFKYPWCTSDMLEQAMESVFYFGSASARAYGMTSMVDENGATGDDFHQAMDNRIENLDRSDLYFFWSPMIYNFATALVHALNRTETVLQTRNQTLADWFTNGHNHQTNGKEFIDLLKHQFYHYPVKTQAGLLTWNGEENPIFPQSVGVVSGVLQVQRNRSSPNGFWKPPVFALSYQGQTPIYRYLRENVIWRTSDGKPHRDKTLVIESVRPVVSGNVDSGLKGIACLLLVFTLCLGFYSLWKERKMATSQSNPETVGNQQQHQSVDSSSNKLMKKTAIFTLFHCLGSALGLIYIIVIPSSKTSEMAKLCSVASICFICGHIIAIASTMLRLEWFRAILSLQRLNNKVQLRIVNSKNQIQPNERVEKVLKKHLKLIYVGVGIGLAIVTLVATIIWLTLEPVAIVETTSEPIVDRDGSIVEIYKTSMCQFSVEKASSQTVLAIVAIIVGFMLIRCVSTVMRLKRLVSMAIHNRPGQSGQFVTKESIWSPFVNFLIGSTVISLAAILLSAAIFGLTSERGILTLAVSVLISMALASYAIVNELLTNHLINNNLMPNVGQQSGTFQKRSKFKMTTTNNAGNYNNQSQSTVDLE